MNRMFKVYAIMLVASVSCLTVADAMQTVKAWPLKLQQQYKLSKQYSGSIVPEERSKLSFELSGRVATVKVKAGCHVRQGQLLASLSTTLLDNERESLVSTRTIIKTELKLAQISLMRWQRLKNSNHASQQKLDEAQARYDGLKAQLKRQNHLIDSLDIRLNKAKLIAPYNGYITERFVDTGGYIVAGSPVLELSKQQKIEAVFGLPHALFKYFTLQQKVSIKDEAGHTYSGQVTHINLDLNKATHTFELRVSLPATDQITTGSLVTLPVYIQQRVAGYWLPLTALVQNYSGLWSVYTLTPTAKDYKVAQDAVTIISSQQNCAYVKPLSTNPSLVISTGTHRVFPGEVVTAKVLAADGACRG